MVDARRLLDVLVGASSRPGQPGEQQGGFLQGALDAFGKGGAGQAVRQATGGQSADQLAQKARTS